MKRLEGIPITTNLYQAIIQEKNEIIKSSLGIDFLKYKFDQIGFNYDQMMNHYSYSIDKIRDIQNSNKVGNTPLVEMKNINKLISKISKKGYGAKIFIKDEACNPSGSFKDRRASLSIHQAKEKGYEGVVCATSGNFGAAVASQAAMHGLKAIIIQEVFDSNKVGQPEILEKSRACASYGAEVIQLTVGPELFFTFLSTLKETGYFNASLYSPLSIVGVETLGYEIAEECQTRFNQFPDAVIVTNAGGGNVTGTARGLIKAGASNTQVIGASVDLKGLHMASDQDFNRKSFTTGHTGFGIPFSINPDRVDVPFSAARPLRYLDRYVLISQGEVFYTTEMLAQLEGMERGPAGNTSLTAAISLAKEMRSDQIIVVQETEYTGAGKHPTAQLTFAKENGVKIMRGNPENNIPGENIIIPENISQLSIKDVDLDYLRGSFINFKVNNKMDKVELTDSEIKFLSDETKWSIDRVKTFLF
ncbi:2-amino-4-oxopentanoate thiolase subunit OrtB [Pseudogracilibacillus auburnensis]|uniref:2-amino-4-oxopentanoate thiolase subunit OrtB n=1 Tax=Pseudogracilibacillus auburnensis TaxID=1494959 RepID=UPI001A977B84|nr:2-amino-4-oxopentanoate thiolase subunit OrtB [Pseudogracilibacillus auburnensis]MBO1001803.1 PLP-dependent lyase/thiolase [Pseudogracilibacillus auburnensis]